MVEPGVCAHGKQAARKTRGIEAALADYSPMTIAALATEDSRQVTVRVAGAGAPLVPKVTS